MKKRYMWISDTLVKEIEYAQQNLKKNKGDKKITKLEASDRLGKYLNAIRNNKVY